MYSSYSLPKCFVTVPILAMQLLLIGSASSLNLTNTYLNHKCRINQGKYRPGSKYEHNLNAISRDLTNWTSFRDGFKSTTRSDDPNSITVIFQCRGDSLGPKCGSCAATAVKGFRKRCPRNRGGIIWYDQCFLDISNFNDPSLTPRKLNYEDTFSMYNPNNVKGDRKLFNKKTSDFLKNLMLKADKPDEQRFDLVYYAAGVENIGTNKLYAMVQCAKDITECTSCLEWSIKELSKCCDGKQGARVIGTSCNLRYEIYPFLRVSATRTS